MKKSVTLTLDKIRNLRYGMNAMIMIEELTGINVTRLDMSRVGIKDIRAIILAGLYHEDKELTLEQVGDLMDQCDDYEELVEKMGEALTLAFGDKTKKGKKPVAKK